MTSLAVCDKFFVVAKGLHIDLYDNSNHHVIDIPITSKYSEEHNIISDIVASSDCKYLAITTSTSKELLVYEAPHLTNRKLFQLARSASKIKFSTNNEHILVADKSGFVYIYDINKNEDKGTKILGHLSLLLDVLQTKDENYIITCDRDEKIKVSCYPNTYNINTYCLGHKEFVNNIDLLPHDDKYLISTSGDGTIKLWDYEKGKLCHTINTCVELNDTKLKEQFINIMEEDGIEVVSLPIVHLATTQIDDTHSLIAVTVYTSNILLIYRIHTKNNQYSHLLLEKLVMERFPAAIQLHNLSLYVYDDNHIVTVYNIVNNEMAISLQVDRKVKMLETTTIDPESQVNNLEQSVRVLYKRRYDNVQEYQERKKQRLEKSV